MQGDKLHQFLMPYSLYRELQKKCKADGVSGAEFIRNAIRACLDGSKCECQKPEVSDEQ